MSIEARIPVGSGCNFDLSNMTDITAPTATPAKEVAKEKFYSLTSGETEVEMTHFYGNCRSVEQYEKMNRIGEGTYGIVCTPIPHIDH
jgi:hypothetical protein